MQYIISITRQGQLTIPRQVREKLGIHGQTQAVLEVNDGKFEVEPRTDFWSLVSSLKSSVTLTDTELDKARDKFGLEWPRDLSKK